MCAPDRARRGAAWLAAVAALVAAGAAYAAAAAVSLELQGGIGNRELVACGIRHHYTLYRLGTPISVTGTVRPAPAESWRVKVKLKRCAAGRFRTVFYRYVAGRPDGSFRATVRPARPGYYFARAYYYGVTPAVRSDKQYLRLR